MKKTASYQSSNGFVGSKLIIEKMDKNCCIHFPMFKRPVYLEEFDSIIATNENQITFISKKKEFHIRDVKDSNTLVDFLQKSISSVTVLDKDLFFKDPIEVKKEGAFSRTFKEYTWEDIERKLECIRLNKEEKEQLDKDIIPNRLKNMVFVTAMSDIFGKPSDFNGTARLYWQKIIM